jgi:hypothetical protein
MTNDKADAADVAQRFLERIQAITLQYNLITSIHRQDEAFSQVDIEFTRHFPMWLRIDVLPQEKRAFLYGIVRTVGLPGDKSDYHDLISLVWAAALRCREVASVRLVDIPHPVVPNELHGRFVLFDKQPAASFIQLDSPDYETYEQIFDASIVAASGFSAIYRSLEGDPDAEEWNVKGATEFAEELKRQLGYKAKKDSAKYNDRYNPNWSYWRLDSRGITVFSFDANLQPLIAMQLIGSNPQTLKSVDGGWLITGPLRNAVGKKTLSITSKLLRAVGENPPRELPLLKMDVNFTVIPTESHLICTYDGGILAIVADCGYDRFVAERSALAERHRAESAVLFSGTRYVWKDRVDDDRFELLILDLLAREPGVHWARKVGRSRAADAGRDILADWYLGPAPWQKADPQTPITRKRVIVQCKALAHSISLSDVGDVPVFLDLHDAQGFLLVAHPALTPQLVDYMTRVPSQRGFWADWWTTSEIEDRLRANRDIALRYTDLFDIFDETVTIPGDAM